MAEGFILVRSNVKVANLAAAEAYLSLLENQATLGNCEIDLFEIGYDYIPDPVTIPGTDPVQYIPYRRRRGSIEMVYLDGVNKREVPEEP